MTQFSGPDIINLLKRSDLKMLARKAAGAKAPDVEECEHQDICYDERICLDCSKDMTEELACRAEYYADMREDR